GSGTRCDRPASSDRALCASRAADVGVAELGADHGVVAHDDVSGTALQSEPVDSAHVDRVPVYEVAISLDVYQRVGVVLSREPGAIEKVSSDDAAGRT